MLCVVEQAPVKPAATERAGLFSRSFLCGFLSSLSQPRLTLAPLFSAPRIRLLIGKRLSFLPRRVLRLSRLPLFALSSAARQNPAAHAASFFRRGAVRCGWLIRFVLELSCGRFARPTKDDLRGLKTRKVCVGLTGRRASRSCWLYSERGLQAASAWPSERCGKMTMPLDWVTVKRRERRAPSPTNSGCTGQAGGFCLGSRFPVPSAQAVTSRPFRPQSDPSRRPVV